MTQGPMVGFHDLAVADFARASNRAAAWIGITLGRRTGEGFQILGQIGLRDIRYCVFVVAASKKVSILQSEKAVVV